MTKRPLGGMLPSFSGGSVLGLLAEFCRESAEATRRTVLQRC
jgi:hypothetical protein